MTNEIKKYPFKPGLKLEFEIFDLTERIETYGNMMAEPHRAQFYHILWIEKGKGTHYIDFSPIQIQDNTILFIPMNSVNRYDIDGLYEGKAILFTDSFFCKNQQDFRFLNSSMLFSDIYPITKFNISNNTSELRAFLNGMETEYLRKNDSEQYSILHNMLHIFLLQSEREIRKQGTNVLKQSAELDNLLLFKELLEKNFRKEKLVKRYANELNISEKLLHKATTQLIDKTPKQVIDERILLETKRLLVHSNLSIKEIAYDLGFEEPTNFIKYFRKHTNMTPAEFREQK